MGTKRKPSLKLNMVLNVIRNISSVIFPLITFPYISRVLGVDNLGKYSFSQSVISYFILFAGLGIPIYAVREGSKFCDDKVKFQSFSCEIFSVNMISTVTSYILLIIFLVLVPKLNNYQTLIIIFSFQIIFKTLGMEWIYSIYEDYIFITVRSIVFQILSFVLMFSFVKNDSQINLYALITVLASVGAELINFIYSKRYCSVRIIKDVDWKRHFKPIMVLFASSAAVSIYVSSDITLLGLLVGDYSVGIYSISAKIYTVMKGVVFAAMIVYIPRLSYYLDNDKSKAISVAYDAYNNLLTLIMPVSVGIFVLRKEIVLLIAGEAYISAVQPLMILCVALPFCLLAGFWGQCILIPARMESTVFKATIVSAILNILLNLFLIPILHENAAALTTLLAEILAYIWCMSEGREIVDIRGFMGNTIKIVIGCVGIIVLSVVIKTFEFGTSLTSLLTIVFSIIIYFGLEILLGNEAVLEIVRSIRKSIYQK